MSERRDIAGVRNGFQEVVELFRERVESPAAVRKTIHSVCAKDTIENNSGYTTIAFNQCKETLPPVAFPLHSSASSSQQPSNGINVGENSDGRSIR